MKNEEKVWNIKHAEAWKLMPPPARPSPTELDIYSEYIERILAEKGTIKLLILGSTPEFRDLAQKFKIVPSLVDNNPAVHEALSLLRKIPGKEIVINSDWLNLSEENKYDLILGDIAVNMLPKEKFEAFFEKMSKILEADGFCIQKISIRPVDFNEANFRDKLKEYRELNTGIPVAGWMMTGLLCLGHYYSHRFQFGELLPNIKHLFSKEEYELLETFAHSPAIYCPRPYELYQMIRPHLAIKEIRCGLEPESLGGFPVYVMRKKNE